MGFSGCGLPSIALIEPPVEPGYAEGSLNSPGQQILYFRHNRENDVDDFKGYDLYYKLYPPDTTDSSTLTNDENYIESIPRETGPGRLQARGFLRLVAVTNRDDSGETSFIIGDTVPHISLGPASSSITFSVDVREPINRPEGSIDRTVKDAEIVVSWDYNGTRSRGFRRRNSTDSGTSQPQDVFRGFWDGSGYSGSDHDISRMFPSNSFDLGGEGFNNSNQLNLVLYAITYGVDGSSFQRYYSTPLRLPQAIIVTSPE